MKMKCIPLEIKLRSLIVEQTKFMIIIPWDKYFPMNAHHQITKSPNRVIIWPFLAKIAFRSLFPTVCSRVRTKPKINSHLESHSFA